MYYEGLSTKAYLDPVGIPTICYGETEGVVMGQITTKSECDRMLKVKLGWYATRVYLVVNREMTPYQHAAFTSFAYNVGVESFKESTLLRKFNSGDAVGACNELPRWVYAGGKKLNGLVKRREAERKLCLGL